MEFFKPVIVTITFSLIVCSLLIVFLKAPGHSVMLGGFTVIVLSLGRAVYDHFRGRITQKISPFL